MDKIFLYLFLNLVLLSCNHSSNHSYINQGLAVEFNIDTTKVVYHYYQKYGFTDVCENIRFVTKQEASPNLNKKLPISQEDWNIIHSFDNEIQHTLNDTIFYFKTKLNRKFKEIELAFSEFKANDSLYLDINQGEYEIIQTKFSSILKIYVKKQKLYYLECFRCDGT